MSDELTNPVAGDHVSELVEKSVAEAGRRDFDAFDSTMQDLYKLPFETTSVAVQDFFAGVLRSVFGSNPNYDQLIKVSKGVHMELEKHADVSPYTVESIIRSYYGDAEMTKDLPGEAAMLLELAIAGVLLSGPADR